MKKNEEEIEDVLVEEQETIEDNEKEVELTDAIEEVETPEDEQDEVEQLKEQIEEEKNKYLRLLADYDNFRRRATLDKEALQKYQSQKVLTNLIPVLDNFSRAIAVEAKSDEARTMMEGMDMIYRSLVDALKSEGLIEIEALDQEFDPNYHQAIMTGNEEDKPSGVVLEEMQKGYILKDRVLRPSMVKVNE
ncbi:nucleotide exchange factor GrpE [Sporosarcina sp. Marseille-Q4063]|uniref:nucleotide exchange factor GrpE n=1 Tax=Sporosarcina sp. Marseille-Q4063 TaxID=2810514 RepID=UPI001BAE7045|nr:nucleotide exchange factor GrpE [Sporosarcina sp. Marseille-Q4063]QUW22196.1 nucleotide exchange factor GrpE [Sporosarcina sp. Marseille-Q4063]